MPTGGDSGEYYTLAQKYGSDATNTNSLQYNLSTPLSGRYSSSYAYDQGSNGLWWSSSTFGDSNYMHSLEVNPITVYRSISHNRYYGQSMRCLMAD